MYPDFFRLCPGWTRFFYEQETTRDLDVDEDWCEQFYLTPLDTIRVVVRCRPGQFPLHPPFRQRLSPFIERIYSELEEEGYSPTRDGAFEHWARQGVFFLTEGEMEPRLSAFLKKNEKNIVSFLEDLPKGIFREINRTLIQRGGPISF